MYASLISSREKRACDVRANGSINCHAIAKCKLVVHCGGVFRTDPARIIVNCVTKVRTGVCVCLLIHYEPFISLLFLFILLEILSKVQRRGRLSFSQYSTATAYIYIQSAV